MDPLSVVRRSRAVFPLAALAALAMLFVSEGSYWQSVSDLDRRARAIEARADILELKKNILDAETGQRGYLLSGRKEYLEPYTQALEPINGLLKDLNARYSGDAGADAVIKNLTERIKLRLSLIAETIHLKKTGSSDHAAELVLSGFGKDHLDQIQQLGNTLLAQETSAMAGSRKSIDETLLLGRVGVMALTALSLLGLFFHLRHAAANEAVRRELQRTIQAKRDQLEILVAQRTASLTALAHHLQTAREDERHKLARNLHDELGALLTSAKLDAARIKSRLAGAAPEAQERLAHLVATLNTSIALGRSIIEDLRPSTLANLGLVSALDILAREFGEHSGVNVQCALAPVKLKASAELVVFRLVQEAFTNISKYAKASRVWVDLGMQGSEVQVTVRDNGTGFDTAAPAHSAYGLLGMRFRVEAEQGLLRVTSTPGGGTSVQASLAASA